LSIQQDDKAVGVIQEFGKVVKVRNSDKGDYFVLDLTHSSKEAQIVFGNFHFPLLEYTKTSMKNRAEERGFIEIMNRTWFCYFPVGGEPCGTCNPCVYSIDECMAYRFNKAAMRRYRLKKARKYLRQVAQTTGLIHVWRFLKSFRSSEG